MCDQDMPFGSRILANGDLAGGVWANQRYYSAYAIILIVPESPTNRRWTRTCKRHFTDWYVWFSQEIFSHETKVCCVSLWCHVSPSALVTSINGRRVSTRPLFRHLGGHFGSICRHFGCRHLGIVWDRLYSERAGVTSESGVVGFRWRGTHQRMVLLVSAGKEQLGWIKGIGLLKKLGCFRKNGLNGRNRCIQHHTLQWVSEMNMAHDGTGSWKVHFQSLGES